MKMELLTAQEAADYLKVKRRTLYTWAKCGRIPCSKIGKQLRFAQADLESVLTSSRKSASRNIWQKEPARKDLVLCGQDCAVDILADYLQSRLNEGQMALRVWANSLIGLNLFFQGRVNIAVVHLWSEQEKQYNLPYVKHTLSGRSVTLVRLFGLPAGLYVRQGNGKHIYGLEDLCRPDVVLVNRERGSGARVLLDEKLKAMNLSASQVTGYENECISPLAAVRAVARGEGDVGLGPESIVRQVSGVEFLPLQKEWYDMVFLTEFQRDPAVQAMLDFIYSGQFNQALSCHTGYDLSQTGRTIRV